MEAELHRFLDAVTRLAAPSARCLEACQIGPSGVGRQKQEYGTDDLYTLRGMHGWEASVVEHDDQRATFGR